MPLAALATAPTAPALPAFPTTPWFTLDDAFWLTVLVVFVASIVGAIIRQRARDRCLRLFDGDRVTSLLTGAPPARGVLRVASSGVEVHHAVPITGPRGLARGSTLLFESDLAAGLVAVCRTPDGQDEASHRRREAQLKARIEPSFARRSVRALRNLINTIRDAFARAFTLLVGRFGQGRAVGTAVQTQTAQIERVGGEIIALTANAYEPLLERHIGRCVVIELRLPGAEPNTTIKTELPGFLVEYNEKYIALFNRAGDDASLESIEPDPTEAAELGWVRLNPRPASAPDVVEIQAGGVEPIVVRTSSDVAGVLLPGRTMTLRMEDATGLRLERTRAVDLICPRSIATVRFAS